MGLIKNVEPVSITPLSSFRPHRRQYPLKTEAEEGIGPIVEASLQTGVIVECPDSPCNTIVSCEKGSSLHWLEDGAGSAGS